MSNFCWKAKKKLFLFIHLRERKATCIEETASVVLLSQCVIGGTEMGTGQWAATPRSTERTRIYQVISKSAGWHLPAPLFALSNQSPSYCWIIFDAGRGTLEINNIIRKRLIWDDKIHFIYGIFVSLVSIMYCITRKYQIYFNLALRSRSAMYLSTELLFSRADFWCCDLCLVFWVTVAATYFAFPGSITMKTTSFISAKHELLFDVASGRAEDS